MAAAPPFSRSLRAQKPLYFQTEELPQEHQRQLLLHSCYGDPKLPEYLERIVVEGPGEYDWPPAPGSYEGEQIPLHERIWAQIWHQGDIYPATYLAVPVLCEVVARFPELNHATLLSQLVMIERSRPHFQPRLKPHLDAETLTAEGGKLEPESLNGTDRMELRVLVNEAHGHAVLVAKLDNLGKGASGAAVQNLRLMLGV